jgi:hypothetical protein
MQLQIKFRSFFLGLFLVVYVQGYSQKLVKTYYDSAWILTPSTYARYCRVGFIDSVNYQYFGSVNDYYLKTGKLQMTGNYVANVKHGSFNFYYPDGKIKTEGFYKDNRRIGIWTDYYENGNFKDKILFDDIFIKALVYYDSSGVQKLKDGTGEWQTEYFDDIRNTMITIKGYYQDSLMDGTWNYYAKDLLSTLPGQLQIQRSEKYYKGKFVTGVAYLDGELHYTDLPIKNIIPEPMKFGNTEHWTHQLYASIDEYPYLKFLPKMDSALLPVDSYAQFPGGLDSLSLIINNGIRLPWSYIKKWRKSAHFITVLIDKYGKLSIKKEATNDDVFYLKACEALKSLPDWKPAQRNLKSVPNYFIVFVSQDEGIVKVKINSFNALSGSYIPPTQNFY